MRLCLSSCLLESDWPTRGLLLPYFSCFFPLNLFSLGRSAFTIGRQEIMEVAQHRKMAISHFLMGLFQDPILSQCDLVYTFFQPILRDQEEVNIQQKKLKGKRTNLLRNMDSLYRVFQKIWNMVEGKADVLVNEGPTFMSLIALKVVVLGVPSLLLAAFFIGRLVVLPWRGNQGHLAMKTISGALVICCTMCYGHTLWFSNA